MATTYIKLGPIGDYFASNELGIYLTNNSAQEIDDVLMRTRLKQFFKTGFLVEIDKVEYDNIRIRTLNARNIPLTSIAVTDSNILEPVESVLRLPSSDVIPGKRYLVYTNAQGPWEGYDDYITYFNGLQWLFIKPKSGMILPVYNLGISLHYTGTYPSGTWDWNVETQGLPDAEENITYEEYAYSLFAQERAERIAADRALQDLINNLPGTGNQTVTASGVPIQDSNGYYDGTNVETALIEIALAIRSANQNISTLNSNYTNLYNQVQQLLENPPSGNILYSENVEEPTTQTVGGIEAGSTIPEIPVQDVLGRMLNPYRRPEISLILNANSLDGVYYVPKGDPANVIVNWQITKRTSDVTEATLSNVTSQTGLPTPSDPLISGSVSGTTELNPPTQEDGLMTLAYKEGDSTEFEDGPTILYAYMSPILIGAIDVADIGKSGTDLYNLSTLRYYIPKVIKEILFPISYSDKILMIAIPQRYPILGEILDIARMNNITCFNQRVANVTTVGLSNNFTESYIIFEAKYLGSTAGDWKLKLNDIVEGIPL